MKRKTNFVGIIYILVIFLALAAILTSGFFICKELGLFGDKTEVIEYTNDLYKEPLNKTEYGKTLYEELCISVGTYENSTMNQSDAEKLALSVAKIFVYDYFTWTNKKGAYDIGGLYYVDQTKLINISEYARVNFYKNYEPFLNLVKDKTLMPEVINVEVIDVLDNIVSLTITYKESTFDMSYFPISVDVSYALEEVSVEYTVEEEVKTKTLNRVVITSLEAQ